MRLETVKEHSGWLDGIQTSVDGDKCLGLMMPEPAPYTDWTSGGILTMPRTPEFLFPRLILQFP